jgi:hypothetical protein
MKLKMKRGERRREGLGSRARRRDGKRKTENERHHAWEIKRRRKANIPRPDLPPRQMVEDLHDILPALELEAGHD